MGCRRDRSARSTTTAAIADSALERQTVHDEQGRWLGNYGLNAGSAQQLIWLDDLPATV